jgi:hypothetical protein
MKAMTAHTARTFVSAERGGPAAVPRRRDDAIFAALAAATTLGLFVDGWAHIELDSTESFFTPWHALFYAAAGATVGWLASRIVVNARSGRSGFDAIPDGYGLSALGAALFPLAGIADLAWHTAFGIEEDIAALLSPTHLLLFSAGLLLFTGPVRSVWRRSASDGAGVVPGVIVLTLAATTVGFFLQFLSPFVDAEAFAVSARGEAGHAGTTDQVVIGLASILVTTVILIVPLLTLLRHGRPPFGAVTFLVSAVAVLPSAAHGFEHGAVGLVAAPVAGLATDLLVRARPTPIGARDYRLVGAVFPFALWSAFFVVLAAGGELGWAPELWGGAIFLASLTGLMLSLLGGPAASEAESAPASSGEGLPARLEAARG